MAASIDLFGKHVIVTGGYSGIGLEVTRALVSAGAGMLVPARRPEVARDVFDEAGLHSVTVDALDLADLTSVREFA